MSLCTLAPSRKIVQKASVQLNLQDVEGRCLNTKHLSLQKGHQ